MLVMVWSPSPRKMIPISFKKILYNEMILVSEIGQLFHRFQDFIGVFHPKKNTSFLSNTKKQIFKITNNYYVFDHFFGA